MRFCIFIISITLVIDIWFEECLNLNLDVYSIFGSSFFLLGSRPIRNLHQLQRIFY